MILVISYRHIAWIRNSQDTTMVMVFIIISSTDDFSHRFEICQWCSEYTYFWSKFCSGGDSVLKYRLHYITSPPDLMCVVWASMQNQSGIFGNIRKFLDHDLLPKRNLRTNLWMYHMLAKCYWNIHWNDLLVSTRNDQWSKRSPC